MPNSNTNITIRSQLFKYYSNTELFAHLCGRSGCVVHKQCGLHDGGMMEGCGCPNWDDMLCGHWFTLGVEELGSRVSWCGGPYIHSPILTHTLAHTYTDRYTRYIHWPIHQIHTLTDTPGRGPKNCQTRGLFLTCWQAQGCKKLNKNLPRFGFRLDLQLNWYLDIINGKHRFTFCSYNCLPTYS